MTYFNKQQDGFDRTGKVLADIFCGLLILAFAIVFFGVAGGLLAFAVIEGAVLGADYLVPNEDEVSAAVIR